MTDKSESSSVLDHMNLFYELDSYHKAINSVAIIAITDVKGKIVKVNDNFCNISGYSEKEIIGQNHRIIKSGFHSKKFFKDIYRKISNGETWRGEIKNKRKNGTYYWVDTVITPMCGDNNKPINYLALRFDITKRKDQELKYQENVKRGEDRLIKQNEFKNKILFTLSHDIKGPLKSLGGLLYLIERDDISFDQFNLMIGDIRKNINKADELVVDLISLAENNYIKENSQKEIEIKDIVLEIIDSSVEKIIDKNIYIRTSFEHSCKVFSHKELITIIIRNFISNAIKFSHLGGKILVESFNDKYLTTIKVIDYGVGMDKDSINKIKSNIKLSTSGTNGETGSGIGMLICRDLINDLGGTFSVESKENEGSIFSFSFPHTLTKTIVEENIYLAHQNTE